MQTNLCFWTKSTERVANLGTTGFNLGLGLSLEWQLHQHSVKLVSPLNNCVVKPLLRQCRANRFIGRTLFELYSNNGSAFEVNAKVKCLTTRCLPDDCGEQTTQHQQNRDRDKYASAS